uniref:Photosystem II Psb27 protein n=1 Tax=Rhodosorus marinus TaxID=101924 RepID=A0A7S3E9K7_9RHOD
MAFVGGSSAVIGRGVGREHAVCGRGRQGVVMSLSRRDIISLGALAALVPSFAFAEEGGIAPATKAAPTKVSGNYADGMIWIKHWTRSLGLLPDPLKFFLCCFLIPATDAKNVLDNMINVCSFKKGTPGMSDVVADVRKEMNDFVARYRRNNNVNGSASFNTLYTAINTLSGHYASYGNNYPVPEKRKKRLTQQFAEIDKALKRGR